MVTDCKLYMHFHPTTEIAQQTMKYAFKMPETKSSQQTTSILAVHYM